MILMYLKKVIALRLTIADKESHKIIVDYLSKTGRPILSEEGSEIDYKIRKSWDTFWLVDPIDGTKEFIKEKWRVYSKYSSYSKSKNNFRCCVCPCFESLYFADHNLGSYKVNNISSFECIIEGKTQNLKESSYP